MRNLYFGGRMASSGCMRTCGVRDSNLTPFPFQTKLQGVLHTTVKWVQVYCFSGRG